jgi:ABC-type Zn uptake system ZnuABC Zn-binding protein ZnuA
MTRIALTVFTALTAVLAACATGPAPSADDRLSVVATTTQVGSVVAEIGGDAIDLTTLLEPGIEAHDFELSAEAGGRLEEADLILISGAGLEDWLSDAVENIGAADRVRDLSAGIELREAGGAGADHGGEGAGEATGGEDHADEEPASGTDPHYWLAAPNAVRMAENARDALSVADLANAGAYEDRAAELIARLEAADAEVRRLIGEIPEADRKLVTDHDALGYFIDEYGLEFVGSIFPSLDVSSEPSARDVERLVEEIRAQGVRAIFSESSVNPALARAVAAETEAVVVDEPLYTDSLGAAGSGAETLDAMLVHDARVIRDGLLGG